MELQGDVGHVESRFSPFGDSVSVGERYMHGLRHTYHLLINHFGCTDVLLGDDALVKAHFGLFSDSASLDAR